MKNFMNMVKGGRRPRGMGYSDYTSMCKGEDEEPMSEEDYNAMEEDEEGEEYERKSISGSDLLKSIQDYQAVADAVHGGPGASRVELLEARMQAGTLSKSERVELGKIWAGEAAPQETGTELRKSLREHLSDLGDGSDDFLDASDWLQSLTSSIDTSLDELTKSFTSDSRATRQLLRGQGDLIKSFAVHAVKQAELLETLANRLEVVEGTPRRPRAVTSQPAQGRPLAKSVSGNAGPVGGASSSGQLRGTLNKAQVFQGLQSLTKSAADREDAPALDRLNRAAALFESTGEINRDLMLAVEQEVLGEA